MKQIHSFSLFLRISIFLNEIKYELIWEQFTKCIVCGQSKKSCCQNKMLEKENIWYIEHRFLLGIRFQFNYFKILVVFHENQYTNQVAIGKIEFSLESDIVPWSWITFVKMNEIKRIHKSKAFITIVIHI